MKIKRGSILEKIMVNTMASLSQKVFAEEPAEGKEDPKGEGNTEPSGDDSSTKGTEGTEGSDDNTKKDPEPNFEDLMSRARREERAKLYPQINKLKEEKNALLLSEEKLKQQVEKLEKENKKIQEDSTKSDDEKVTTLNKEIEDLKKQLEDTEAKKVDENALRTEIETEIRGDYETKLYREQKLRELADEGRKIIPELVMGNTNEEIDNSIKQAEKRYKEILKREMGDIQMPGGNSNSDSTTNDTFKDVSPTDIRNMSNEDYAEYRKKLNLK